MYDGRKQDFTLVRAESQRQACLKGMNRGYVPSETDDVRPRTGDDTLMKKEEFKAWLSENVK